MTARKSTPAAWDAAKAMAHRAPAICRSYAHAARLALSRLA